MADEVVGLVQGLFPEVAGAVHVLRDHEYVIQPEPAALGHAHGHGELTVGHVQHGPALTQHQGAAAIAVRAEAGVGVALPDAAAVDEHLHGEGGVGRLVAMQQEGVAAEAGDLGGEDHRALGVP